MTKYSEFVEKKNFEKAAILCHEHNIDTQSVLDKALQFKETKDKKVYAELMQGMGQLVGNMTNAAKPVNGMQQPGVQPVMQNTQIQKQVKPQQNQAKTQSIQKISTQLQQLGQMIPQMNQQLQLLQQQ
jgi:uncharacterized protein (DUF885 family)